MEHCKIWMSCNFCFSLFHFLFVLISSEQQSNAKKMEKKKKKKKRTKTPDIAFGGKLAQIKGFWSRPTHWQLATARVIVGLVLTCFARHSKLLKERVCES